MRAMTPAHVDSFFLAIPTQYRDVRSGIASRKKLFRIGFFLLTFGKQMITMVGRWMTPEPETAMFDPDSFSGTFVSNCCRQCGKDWECYRTDPDFVCDECLPPDCETEHPRE